MTSEVGRFRSVCINRTFSNPRLNRFPIARMNRIVITGMMPGRSMWRIRWNLFAPSTFAASCNAGSIAVNAAR